jgi:phosphoribosyl 1,2-cyclic phosphate phosphodiesterase
MKLHYYGTGAAEAIPGLYCSCGICENARRVHGKEIRSRHLTTVDDDIQFDLSPDFFYHINALGMEPRTIKHLVMTHAHGDHFAPDPLNLRRPPFALTDVMPFQLICNETIARQAEASLEAGFAASNIHLVKIQPYATLALDGETTLTALPANHAPEAGGGFIYLLERKGRKLLYAHDTGIPEDEVFNYLSGRELDAASLDCTGAYKGAGAHHMHIPGCEKVVSRFMDMGALKKSAKVILSHFSHGGGATQADLEKEAGKRGWISAYDGMVVEI